MTKYDAIIIGGQVPMLTAAAYLAKAGKNVLVLEKSSYLGGTAICTEMSVPGHRFCPAATGEYWANPKIVADLKLHEFGLEQIIAPMNLTTTFGDGNYLSLYADPDRTAEEISRFSQHDAEAWKKMIEKWIDSLNTFAPGIKDMVIGYDGFVPTELEQKFGMTNGDIQHGTYRWVGSLDNRPAPGYSDYRAPINGLYMGGNSTWPTASLDGINGWNVSTAILKDMEA